MDDPYIDNATERGKQMITVKLQAQINKKYLGTFKSAAEAAMAYDIEAVKLYGEFAKTNFKAAA